MDLHGKKVLLVGLAKTGIATIKFLHSKGALLTVNDIKGEEELKEVLSELEGLGIEYILGSHPQNIEGYELVVVSPGVPLDIPFIAKFKEKKVEVISEIELSYRYSKAPFVGITGTNGKTTTTSLVGEIFKLSSHNTFVVGNIGTPVVDVVDKADENSVLVTELSSFQLESIESFKPRVSAILNITPDHLNRHKTMENYIAAKARIFENQDENDYTVLNYDCEQTRSLAGLCKSNVVFFSRKERLESGVFVDGGRIVVKAAEGATSLMDTAELKIPGPHNLENALAAVAIAVSMQLPFEIIASALRSFEGVEHRLEFVRSLNGIDFINDSKGTNPDASIKAIQSFERPLILIAGGMDKGGDFDDFVAEFGGKVKGLVLLGETAQKLEDTAVRFGFKANYRVENMEQAVQKAFALAAQGDIVLLSPACASWDMYPSYEVRGRDFKENVMQL
ncbi:UDP-N-acetylmuramoylalanine--D-glutamate ligase MurD [Peptoclostridium acidaminophilum DSM 3953]|uniref:UDP-N-acetylmuramoylalanine--D-glutamate ligase n=1 Tax=Peptoclostridium acidaminophilum DSM 3953 TaxID=1286171 RepID=W8T3J8_PEPAC|nr:UDP-N-acetylmuramoyl-L-alanine--D-glutamate ligase [Peptoclostridium acidaminophilum]AHM56344.1 UDP-N-acetylmuramoylalanine--D-glutamate ligase MurD [Peptoclostridium acidaminophilum DSM 3953]